MWILPKMWRNSLYHEGVKMLALWNPNLPRQNIVSLHLGFSMYIYIYWVGKIIKTSHQLNYKEMIIKKGYKIYK